MQSPNGLEKGHENGKKAKKMKIFGGSVKSQVAGKTRTSWGAAANGCKVMWTTDFQWCRD